MIKPTAQEHADKASAERQQCSDWLVGFMLDGQPRFLTKAELQVAAMAKLGVSKSSFDFAWIDAIERTGRQDWYEPIRTRRGWVEIPNSVLKDLHRLDDARHFQR